MKAKLGAIFLVSVIALAGAGAAYALWYEDLYIWTDNETGNVDVDWSIVGYGSNQEKPVSTFDLRIGNWATPEDADATSTIRFWIYDAYPCVEYWFKFDLHCVGTIPVHFEPFVIYDSGFYPMLDEAWIEEKGIYINYIERADGTTDTFTDPGVLIEYIQLHEGDVAYGTFMIHFNNQLPQSTTFYYDLHSRAHQYNELNWGPPE